MRRPSLVSVGEVNAGVDCSVAGRGFIGGVGLLLRPGQDGEGGESVWHDAHTEQLEVSILSVCLTVALHTFPRGHSSWARNAFLFK